MEMEMGPTNRYALWKKMLVNVSRLLQIPIYMAEALSKAQNLRQLERLVDRPSRLRYDVQSKFNYIHLLYLMLCAFLGAFNVDNSLS